MNDDQQLTALLRHDAPAERDPLFRISVIERRERMLFHRQVTRLAVAACCICVLLAIGARVGGLVSTMVGAMLFVLAMIAVASTVFPRIRRLWQIKR